MTSFVANAGCYYGCRAPQATIGDYYMFRVSRSSHASVKLPIGVKRVYRGNDYTLGRRTSNCFRNQLAIAGTQKSPPPLILVDFALEATLRCDCNIDSYRWASSWAGANCTFPRRTSAAPGRLPLVELCSPHVETRADLYRPVFFYRWRLKFSTPTAGRGVTSHFNHHIAVKLVHAC